MPGRKQGKRRAVRLFNWLKKLDREAARLPRAASWLSPYGPFMLARYPNLQPQRVPGNIPSQLMCESGEETAAQQFAEWESRIASNKETAVCLNDLDEKQRRQLAALLLDIVVDLEMRTATGRSSQWKRQLCKEAPIRLRMLNRKLHKARQAVQELMNYAQDSSEENDPNSPLYRARRMLGQPYIVAASNALRELDIRYLPDAQKHIEIATESRSVGSEDVEVFGMVRLYWFFRHGCNLKGDESEVRVARLRNAFWTKYDVSEIAYRAKYVPGQSQGCEAVHVAVHRFKGTS